MHNSWHPVHELKLVKGFKKVENYIKTVRQQESWYNNATTEEQEAANIELESRREARERWLNVHRIIDERYQLNSKKKKIVVFFNIIPS